MQKKTEKAVAYLCRERNHHINMLAALQGKLAEVVAAEEQGCLFCTDGDIWQLAADDEETALRFYEMIPQDASMLEVQQLDWVPLLKERFCPTCVENYYNVWYAAPEIALPEIGACVRTLTAGDGRELAGHYHLPGADCGKFEETRLYLEGRIESGTMFGLYFDDRLAGFVGTHGEGSLGVLTVLPEFRRRGLGTYLEQLAIQKALERGHIPFGQVAADNQASLALQKSLGMTIADQLVCWLEK